ncbi:9964_t:CDS:2 [Ambispora leptoticha]|uniref:9964_t:CDS:1 n=1 Tax=Ambispora leptoticha TaxID=144679 RepID=A0A9N8V9H0_9GLOM|nr:9964_t:CDS:2 [Ambispora leptoticha]
MSTGKSTLRKRRDRFEAKHAYIYLGCMFPSSQIQYLQNYCLPTEEEQHASHDNHGRPRDNMTECGIETFRNYHFPADSIGGYINNDEYIRKF